MKARINSKGNKQKFKGIKTLYSDIFQKETTIQESQKNRFERSGFFVPTYKLCVSENWYIQHVRCQNVW
jgi:hypothetical protein